MDQIKFNPKNGAESTINGKWDGMIFIPTTLAVEAAPWIQAVKKFSAYFPDQKFLVSSVISGLMGGPRTEPKSSHARALACDIAPLFSESLCFDPSGRSPRLCDKRPILAVAALAVKELPFGVVAEGDHFHFDKRLSPNAYAYSTYRKDYDNDAQNQLAPYSPLVRKLMVCFEDGTISVADPSVLQGGVKWKERRIKRKAARQVRRANTASKLDAIRAKFPHLPGHPVAKIAGALFPPLAIAQAVKQIRHGAPAKLASSASTASIAPSSLTPSFYSAPQDEIAPIYEEDQGYMPPQDYSTPEDIDASYVEVSDETGPWTSDPELGFEDGSDYYEA